MATTTVNPDQAATPSISDLRAMLTPPTGTPEKTNTPAPEGQQPVATKEPEVKTPTPEPQADGKPAEKAVEPEDGKKPEAASGTAETKQTTDEEDGEELPTNVKKRIAKEVERTTKAQRAISEAVAERKAAEARLKDITTDANQAAGKPGSEPAQKTTAPQPANGKPVRPVRPEESPEPTMGEDETWPDHQARLQKHRTDHRAALVKYDADMATYEEKREDWLLKESERIADSRIRERVVQDEGDQFLEAAVKEHGRDVLDPAIQNMVASTTPEFQTAFSQLETWPALAIHLAKNPDTLQEISDVFAASPHRGMAALGRLEASLTASKAKPAEAKPAADKTGTPTPATTTRATVDKPLPEPMSTVGGRSTPLGAVILNGDISFSTFKREATKALDRKAG